MAAVTKLTVILFLLSWTSISGADETGKNGEEITQLAYEKMNRAILEMNTKISACLKKEQDTILPSQVFPKLALSNNEWKTAVAYLSAKALTHCEENTLANALMAFSQFKFLEKKVSGKNGTRKLPNDTWEEICCNALAIKMKDELKYREIDPKIRRTLENIPELNRPFNPLAALKALGL